MCNPHHFSCPHLFLSFPPGNTNCVLWCAAKEAGAFLVFTRIVLSTSSVRLGMMLVCFGLPSWILSRRSSMDLGIWLLNLLLCYCSMLVSCHQQNGVALHPLEPVQHSTSRKRSTPITWNYTAACQRCPTWHVKIYKEKHSHTIEELGTLCVQKC